MSDHRRWVLAATLVFGAWARFVHPLDIEYKEDEEFLFFQSLDAGVVTPWPWLGLGSTVHVRNPGASVWFFMLLGRVFQAWDPVSLSQAVQALNVIALLLAVLYGLRVIRDPRERALWEWAIAVAAVNPIAVVFQRKIWAQSVLPFLAIVHLWTWSRRNRAGGAFAWGLLAVLIGQVHMSGFFVGMGFGLWTLFAAKERARTRWKPVLAGAALGTLPLVPWLRHFFFEPTGHLLFYGWSYTAELRYFVFWLTSPLGLHLGNVLGVRFGDESVYQQLADFAAWPSLSDGRPTYAVGLLHLGLLGAGITSLLRGWRSWAPSVASVTRSAQSAAFLVVGVCMTLSTIIVRRFYLLGCFPLDSLALTRAASISGRGRLLMSIIVMEALVTAGALDYLHAHRGSIQGDYGPAYAIQPRARILSAPRFGRLDLETDPSPPIME